jgi:hypothetical protein
MLGCLPIRLGFPPGGTTVPRQTPRGEITALREHDPEKWIPVFG